MVEEEGKDRNKKPRGPMSEKVAGKVSETHQAHLKEAREGRRFDGRLGKRDRISKKNQ